MSEIVKHWKIFWLGASLAVIGLIVTGCGALSGNEARGTTTGGVTHATNMHNIHPNSSLPPLRVSDLVIVDFMDLPPTLGIPQCRERVRDDGKLVLPYGVTVVAAGKTPTELQDAIQKAYVPSLYHRLTVSVKTEERVYYVGGEVKGSGRFEYRGEITVLRAIDSAGGFTDFARRTAIELRRANGEFHVIDWKKAKRNPKLDLPVYPNDQVIVPQRLY